MTGDPIRTGQGAHPAESPLAWGMRPDTSHGGYRGFPDISFIAATYSSLAHHGAATPANTLRWGAFSVTLDVVSVGNGGNVGLRWDDPPAQKHKLAVSAHPHFPDDT